MNIELENGTTLQAPEGLTPQQIDEVVEHYASTQPQGFMSRVGNDISNDALEAQNKLAQSSDTNTLAPFEAGSKVLASAISSPIKEAVAPAMPAINSAANTVAQYIPGMDAYNGLTNDAATAARPAAKYISDAASQLPAPIKSLGNAVGNTLQSAMGVEGALAPLSAVRDGLNSASDYMANSSKAMPAGATAADIDSIKSRSYAQAKASNEMVHPDQYANPVAAKIDALMPKAATANGVLSKDQTDLASKLGETAAMVRGQPIDMAGIDTVDKALNAKITDSLNPDGTPSDNTRTLMKLKGDMRALISPDNLPGSAPANLFNGRTAAAAQFGLNDMAEAERAAALKGGSAVHYQTGYRRLANDEGFMAGQPQSVKDAIETAATPTLADKVTGGIPMHLSALAASHFGGMEAFGGVEAAKVGIDALKSKIVQARGAAVKQAIIDNAMSKIKDIPEAQAPTAPLQLTNQRPMTVAQRYADSLRAGQSSGPVIYGGHSPQLALPSPEAVTPPGVGVPNSPPPPVTNMQNAEGRARSAALGNEGALPAETIPVYPRTATMPGQKGNLGQKTLGQIKALALQGKSPAEIADFVNRMKGSK